MLKHVHQSPPKNSNSVQSQRYLVIRRGDDSSLNSSRSSESYNLACSLSSRSSSNSSLCDSSLCSVSFKPAGQCLVKIYARCLRSDIEYKTLSVGYSTTSKEVITNLLNKYRMKHRDPNLFFLVMEVELERKGSPLQTLIVLDDEAKLAELMSCYPKGNARFTLQMRRGGLIKIYDGILMACSKYKSLLVSDKTTVEETIKLLLHCNNRSEEADNFSLFEVSQSDCLERKLEFSDKPVKITKEWINPTQHAFVLHYNNATLPCESEDQTIRQLANRVSVISRASYNDYENYFYI